ncbi:hypothetical protein ACFO4N_06395 [Camelliibacillus cellulosilyticus]|uniref:NodB homology domain-containing protein n=1 Tax=Camelliibacillus cellulosilyticus TaxID=2174486 RepID=A0ABV9GJ96_9BACL
MLTNIRNGDIILLHDSGRDRSQTIKALKVIIPRLKRQGYHFVTVSQLLKVDPKYQKLFDGKMVQSPSER